MGENRNRLPKAVTGNETCRSIGSSGRKEDRDNQRRRGGGSALRRIVARRVPAGPGREVDGDQLSGFGIEDCHGSLHSVGMGETPDPRLGSNRIGSVVSNPLPGRR